MSTVPHINRKNLWGDIRTRILNLFRYIVIDQFQYCYVRHIKTGELVLHEGPQRFRLKRADELVGVIQDKVRLANSEFALIVNPYSSSQHRILEGEREIRVGPQIFSLHPGEKIVGVIQREYVLKDDQGLLLYAEKDFVHPDFPDRTVLAGTKLLLKGPRRYIPDRFAKVTEVRESQSLSEAEGVYVQNNDTGDVRLVQGPADLFIEQNEDLWDKYLTHEELQALGYEEQLDDRPKDRSRILAAKPHTRTKQSDAVVVELEDNEAIYLYDGSRFRVEFGPQRVFLHPTERPKVLFISGGVPVRPNVLRIAKLELGPDFIKDKLLVRTKDNATLEADVTYRWRFAIDREHPERLFALKDFVGFVAQTLSSEIREEAAKHNFEEFHSNAAGIVKRAIFADQSVRKFTENDLEIFGVDVEHVTPDDDEIAEKLADAIKTNVDIYTKRVQEEAQLESERRLIAGRIKNEETRADLVKLQASNDRIKALAEAETRHQTDVERARGTAEALEITATAQRVADDQKLQDLTARLETPGGKAYIELEKVRVLQSTDKVVVPTDSKLVLGLDHITEE